MKKEHTTKIAIFRKKEIRKTIYQKEWWFVINDIVKALTDTPNVRTLSQSDRDNYIYQLMKESPATVGERPSTRSPAALACGHSLEVDRSLEGCDCSS